MYGISGVVMCAALLIMALALPRRHPKHSLSYSTPDRVALASAADHTGSAKARRVSGVLLRRLHDVLDRCARCCWKHRRFHSATSHCSAVMLSGVIGAFVAPLAGRLADKGHGQAVTGISIGLLAITFVLTWLGSSGSLVLFIIAGITLDAGAQANLVRRPKGRSTLCLPKSAAG